MQRSRFGTWRLLAAMLSANLVWVFFACTLQCLAAAGPSCLEHARGEGCCAADVAAPCEAEELSGARDGCAVLAERGVLAASGQRQRAGRLDAPLATFLLLAVGAPASAPRRVARTGHGPPRARPLDRLPVLLI